ncbi:MAG: hypothetical protein JW783_08800 [Bacteroidales bacterium]|nr:hypothetical protein [Bacteroidales bacterium]MBN2748912.1 hypothetical protein [Bacteroidales bacterium]
MDPVLKKLRYKGQSPICIAGMPESFADVIAGIDANILTVSSSCVVCSWILFFVSNEEQVRAAASCLGETMAGDPTIWFAYPKGTSKKYKSEINRDKGWLPLGDQGFDPVSQVAIDEDWSALRFRKVSSIRALTRSKLGAISQEGKARTQNNAT